MTVTNLIASIRQRLLDIAKARGEDFNLVLTRYALERFLFRLSRSSYRSELILKGALLFQIWNSRMHRPTGDMDFHSKGEADAVAIAALIRNICAVDAPGDGLFFDLENLAVEEIRENNSYGGIRARFIALLGNVRIPVQLDFGFGDQITPEPMVIDYPTLLPMDKPHIWVYPRETVVAEKLEAIVALEFRNSRMKDYFDLWFILTTFGEEPGVYVEAVRQTFKRRKQAIPGDVPVGLSDSFALDEAKIKMWQAFKRRIQRDDIPSLSEVIQIIRKAALLIFMAAAK